MERTRSKTEVRGKRVRGVTRAVRVGQGDCLLSCCEGDSKPAHAKPAYAAPKISPRACRPPARVAIPPVRTTETTCPVSALIRS